VELFEMIDTESTVALVAEGLAPCLASLIGADPAEVPADDDKVANTIVTKLVVPRCGHLAS
jgi:hypothetical protein